MTPHLRLWWHAVGNGPSFGAARQEPEEPFPVWAGAQPQHLAICQMNLFLHDIDDANVARGDTLLEPKHLTGESVKAIRTFDRVLANPPFSLKSWGHDVWSKGILCCRDRYGCPPKSYGDLAFVSAAHVASLKKNGTCGVVLPHGVLFRGGAEGKIREGLIRDDM